MKTLNESQLELISGGELSCTVGTSGVNCTGTLSDWADAYDEAVDWTSRNIIEPVANWF
ncbi:hypothetical protein [Dyella sp.]|uniref:hypothetical protein n=1 Tax=Dyella sp. TaxID=1869338 RepID=UPI002D77D8F9|nr:hypothetical protein [Dyella sp.]HET7332248.1 hypothetical protein [Dyella sp.]